MFEKEAEDSFNCKKVLYKWETDKHSYIDGFKDGAEFGYNKAKEEMQEQIEKMKKYGKLLQDICSVMGNDPYIVWRGLEQRVLILWDKSEEEKGLKMAENILERLLKIKSQDWAEIDKWEIKEND